MKTFPFEFSKVLEWTGAQHLLGRTMIPVVGISTDSRKINPGQLYLALKGPNFDGNNFIADVIQKGASSILTSSMPEPDFLNQLRRQGITVGLVEDGLKALQSLAENYRRQFSIPIVGITGSCGKTTTKDIAFELLEEKSPILKNEGTLNNHFGVPLTLLELRSQHQVCCLELGTSAPGEISNLASIAQPTMGVVLNVGPAHLKMLKSLEGVLEEKWSLIETLRGGVGIFNEDDPLLREKAKNYSGPLFSFGIYHGGQLQASKIEFLQDLSTRFVVIFQGEELGVIKIPFVGLHNIYNVLAALSIGHILGVSWESMMRKASVLKLPSMRWEMIQAGGVLIINDAYNANPQSMSSALETFHALRVDGKKIFVCGDMLDLGEVEYHWHRSLAQDVLKSEVNLLITVGPLSRLMAQWVKDKGFPKTACFSYEKYDEALHRLLEVVTGSDAVLVKGSRAMGLEKVVEGLLQSLQAKHPHPEHVGF
jgi:UDP-N-acetylmuramoyl-tripeptide--D-alanyl-D-alanine ligase